MTSLSPSDRDHHLGRRALVVALSLLAPACGGPDAPAATESGAPSPRAAEADPAATAHDASSPQDLRPNASAVTSDDHAPQRQPLPDAEAIAALPADGGAEFNRLVFEASPYLRQHARNPVDWYPWGEEAFRVARELDRPIFLSVGYATCHWCHVMEHESFEDDDVAALLNATFVCVKVDREERPDLDHVYMQVTQAMTGRGGWPMTVMMTPEAEPFFAGTYIPKDGRAGRGGMMELIPRVAQAWRNQRDSLLADADRITTWLRENSEGSPGADLDASVFPAAAAALAGRFDATHKGFGAAPKFPLPHSLSMLLRWSQRGGDPIARQQVVETLLAMRRGGVYDQLGHGFHRYSTDVRWFLPHFEKMLYDQALHVLAYTGAWQVTGDARLRATAEEVIGYVLRDLGDPAGGFYSAEDADSEGEEGIFYTWTWDELTELLGAEGAALVSELYGAVAAGNYDDEATRRPTGRNLFAQVRPLEEALPDLAAARGVETPELEARLDAIHARLFEVRGERIRPFLDDKVLTDWNGLMIAALARAGAAFDSEETLTRARAAADFLWDHLRDEDGRLLKRWRAGQAGLPATLEDHAFLAWGLLELFQATQDLVLLERARDVLGQMVDHFHDPEAGGFFLTADDAPQLLVRAKEVYDGALPSGNSAAALALLQYARLTGETRYEELAAGTLRAFSEQVRRTPSAHALLLQAVDLLTGGGIEVVVAGDPEDPRTQALLAEVRARHLPNAVLLLHDPDRTAALAALSAYGAAMPPVNGVPTAYLCRDFACEAPRTSPAELGRALDAAMRVSGG